MIIPYWSTTLPIKKLIKNLTIPPLLIQKTILSIPTNTPLLYNSANHPIHLFPYLQAIFITSIPY